MTSTDQAVFGTTTLRSPEDDPASQVKLPNGDAPAALAYDWAFKKWLPVRPGWVSPDGSRYAYTDIQGRIHVVSVADSVDQVVAAGSNWAVITFAAEGIYAGTRDPSRQPSLSGLSLVAPDSGQVRQVTSSRTWTYVANGSAWSASGTGPGLQEGSGNQLVSLDLQSGSMRTWYTRTDLTFRLLGVDRGGHPIIAGVGTEIPILRISAPGAGDRIGGATYIADAFSDAHGLWYVETMTVAVYLIDGTRVRAVARYGSGSTARIAGSCQ